MKHSGKVPDFQDFVECVEKANSGKINTKVLSIGDLFAWKDCTSKQNLKCRGEVPYARDMVKLTAERGITYLLYSTKYDEPCSKVLNFLQAMLMKNFPLP
ncbi:hypothetical protein PR048_010381 [Dryococelus australis]|uniref:Uncharacterized protein n=1 Tax=Dryococelus australis TaxID=614101 RepID=A0ABQ9I312_9NEOP|nr:hypothetical protein PR048_010381 [Dryococelus australis]